MSLGQPYPLLIRASLLLAVSGGFGLGLVLLLSFAFGLTLPWNISALIQAHGQVQALGFVGLFVLAVGTRLLPRFHRTRLEDGQRVSMGGLALAAGIAGRALAQPVPPSPLRAVMLVAGALMCLAGVLLALSSLAQTVRRGRPAEPREPIVLPLTMATSLLSALVLNVVASGQLAAGTATVPGGLDEAILHLELWGFASTIVFAIARHTWPNLLLLQPTRRAFITPSLLFWAIGSLGVPLAWLLVPDLRMPRVLATSSQLVGTSMYLVALRLFEPPARRAAIPLVTDPPRVWLRVAFAFLLDSAAADAARSLFQRMELAAGEARAHTDHHR